MGFRERMIEWRMRWNYIPLMHGLVETDSDRQEIELTGRTNWSPVLICSLVVIAVITEPSRQINALLEFGAIVGALYWIQYYRYQIVADRFEKIGTGQEYF